MRPTATTPIQPIQPPRPTFTPHPSRRAGRAGTATSPLPHLDPPQILALQFYARGYSLAQIAPLVDQPPGGVGILLALEAARLRAVDVPGAVAEARRRGLIV